MYNICYNVCYNYITAFYLLLFLSKVTRSFPIFSPLLALGGVSGQIIENSAQMFHYKNANYITNRRTKPSLQQ